MARITAPSLWLPGFSPEPFEPAALFIETEPLNSELTPSTEKCPAEELAEPALQRSSWRVVTRDTATAVRSLWPQLVRADLSNLSGSVTKFEANLAAIAVLRQVEAEQRPATPEERGTLLRYTGWGGLPASFNLEAEDIAWAKRTRQLSALLADVHDQLNATQRGRIIGMCAVRDYARALLDTQLSEGNDGQLGHLRALLNGTYDRFITKYGCLSTRANALAFRRDPDYPLLLSLEHYDDESETAKKAALFTRRTLTRVVEPATAGEPTEALVASIQWRGRVDQAYMAGLLAAPEDAVLQALAEAGQVFLDPADSEWKTADDYLSGNVKAKLKQAVMSGSAYRRNIDALEQVQPEDLPPASIEPRLGAV